MVVAWPAMLSDLLRISIWGMFRKLEHASNGICLQEAQANPFPIIL